MLVPNYEEDLNEFIINDDLDSIKELFTYDNIMNNFKNDILPPAVFYNKNKIVEYLISIGADVQCFENISLDYAITHENIDLIKILINAGANVNEIYPENFKKLNLLLRKDKLNKLYEN
jgi:ankyrin repeat protein